MKRSKRGEIGRNETLGFILFLVVAAVVIYQSAFVTDVAKTFVDVEQCRFSVVSSSIETSFGPKLWGIEIFRAGVPNPFTIDCPKRYVRIDVDGDGNERIVGDNVDIKLAESAIEKERQMKDFILDEMKSCWRSFGDASDKIHVVEDVETDDAACFACSDIIIDRDFKPVKLDNFYDYADKKVSLVDKKSYAEFLTGGTDLSDVEFPQEYHEKYINIDPNEHNQWSVVFVIKELDNGAESWINRVPFAGSVKSTFIDTRKEAGLPKANSGIVDCYMVDATIEEEKDATLVKTDSSAIGCSGGDINGASFGKVAAGYEKKSIDVTTILGSGLIKHKVARFPMTVRLIPTEDVFRDGQCERMY